MRLIDWLNDLDYQLIKGDTGVSVEDVVYDSRKAKEGTVFVCMKGTKIDSHDFIPAVIDQGTKVLVVEREVEVPEGITVLKVENGRKALANLSAARFGYPARRMVTIGITGTKGKTTTAHMLKHILDTAGKKAGMIGTTGVMIGTESYPTVNTTPESYQLHQYFAKMVEAGCEYMIMEVSSQGIMMHRTDGIVFDYGIFTNISPDHIGPDEHDSFEEYLYYKSQLMTVCKTGLINRDDEHYNEIIAHSACAVRTFGLESAADYMADEIRFVAEKEFVGLSFRVSGEYKLDVRMNIPGRFNVYNALGAVSVASMLGIGKDSILRGLESLWVNGRMEIVYSSPRCTVIVDYAHNAVSLESLLSTLKEYHPKRLVCVFGCGGNRSKDRRYSMGEIGGMLADFNILTADNSRFEKVDDIINDIKVGMARSDGNYIVIPDRREAIIYSITHAQLGDMIAIVGKGHEDYQEIEGVRYPFLDRKVVEEAVSLLEK